jgi:hypothetical protein
MLALFVAASLARASSDPAQGCAASPALAVLDALARGTPAVDAAGETWRVLGRSNDARTRVLVCARGAASTADTVESQWLVEGVGDARAAVRIGVVSDSSFQEAFRGPVKVARSARLPASLPVWEVCGARASGDASNGDRSDNGCRLVVSPNAARGVENTRGQRIVTFIAAGEHPLMDFLVSFDTRSTWGAVADGWRVTETWTWRESSGTAPDGPARTPLTQMVDVRWDAAVVAFVVTPVGVCTNLDVARARLDRNAEGPCVGR